MDGRIFQEGRYRAGPTNKGDYALFDTANLSALSWLGQAGVLFFVLAILISAVMPAVGAEHDFKRVGLFIPVLTRIAGDTDGLNAELSHALWGGGEHVSISRNAPHIKEL